MWDHRAQAKVSVGMKHPRASKRSICKLFGHRPTAQEFVGSDVAGPFISVVTARACWCKHIYHIESTTHPLAETHTLTKADADKITAYASERL